MVMKELPPLPRGIERDTYGRVRVWHVPTGAWAYRAPIDARELLAIGEVLLEKPEEPARPAPKARASKSEG